MSTTEATSKTKLTTKLARLSYAALFEPKEGPNGGKAKYSVSVIIPKSDTETLDKIKAAIAAAEKEGIAGKWEGKKPKVYKDLPLRDGDDTDDEAYANCYFINAKNDKKPVIVGMDRDEKGNFKEITDPDQVYSGCYGRVNVTAYHFNANGNKGIAWSLNSVQKMKDGEPLGAGRSKPEDDFAEEIEIDEDDMFN
jgi:hypothetical protein